MVRARASLAFVVGAAVIFGGLLFRFYPARSSAFEPRLGGELLALATLLLTSSMVLAFVARPRRDLLTLWGPLPAAAALSLVMLLFSFLEPIVRDHLLPAALETAGGFTVIAAALRFFFADRIAAVEAVFPTKKKKARLHERETEVPIESLVPGDEIELQPGDDIPTDGTVKSGGGFVDESSVAGTTLPAAKRAGEFVLAGSNSTIPGLVVRVGAPVNQSLLVQREQLASEVALELAEADEACKLAAGAVALLFLSALVMIVTNTDLRIIERWMPEAAGLILAAVAGAPALALIGGRIAVLRQARRAGMIVARGKDVRALSSVRRWQIDPRVLAAAGGVEVLAFGEESGDRLLAVTEALIASELGPELASVQTVLRSKNIAPLSAAALRRVQAVYHGTVGGERWFVGPQRAIEEEEKISIDPTTTNMIEFLREKGLITWLIGKQSEGIVGAVGIEIASSEEAKMAAQKLRSTVMPGSPDATRQAVARAAGITCDGPPLGKSDGTLLAESSPSPSTGLRVRVIRFRPGMEIRSDRAPRILESSLPLFGDLADMAKRTWRRAWVRAAAVGLVPVGVAAAMSVFGAISPLAGTVMGLSALLVANGGADRSGRR